MTDDQELSREEVRDVLIAKITAAFPQFRDNPELARAVELGSNDDLRKHLAWAELLATVEPVEPREHVEPLPLKPDEERELMRRVLTQKTGNHLSAHEYVMARDECEGFYDGPAWVPFNLWSLYRYEGHSTISECAGELINHPDAESLWAAIGQKYERPNNVAGNLPVICANAIADWRAMPRDTPAQHKAKRDDLARKAKQLAIELERFFLARDPDEHELPGLLDFTQLMTDDERERLDVTVRRMTGTIVNRARKSAGLRMLDWDEYNSIGDDARALGYRDSDLYTPARQDAHFIYGLMLRDYTKSYDYPYGGVPTLPDMLRRIGERFIADGDNPPLLRPNAANAERNRFARAVIKYFWMSYGDVSPNIAARIVSVFFPQGIKDDDVSQMIPRVKAAYPLPTDPGHPSEIFPTK